MTAHGRWYLDLLAAAAATAVCAAGVALGLDGAARFLLALPLVCFLPGYAVVSATFPRSAAGTHELTAFDEWSFGFGDGLRVGATLGAAGRIALSVLCSLAVVSLVALAMDILGFGVALWPVLVGVVAVTAAGLAGAAAARLRVPPRDRCAPSLAGHSPWYESSRRFDGDPTWEVGVPNVALVAGVILLSASVGYAAIVPPDGQQFTEFYVETQNMTFDTQTLYPDQFSAGEEASLDVFVGNHEGSDATYTTVATLQRVAGGDNEPVTVVEQRRLSTTEVSVPAGETERATVSFTPEATDQRLRLVLYLYRGDAPATASPESAYRTLRLWVSVSGGATNALAAPSEA